MGLSMLIGNSLLMKHKRLQEKHQEAYKRYKEAEANYLAPHPEKFMANALQDYDEALEELLGTGYKEHRPFILGAMHDIGNAVLGSLGLQLPQQRMAQIPIAIDPQTGQPVQAGMAQAGVGQAGQATDQPPPAAPGEPPAAPSPSQGPLDAWLNLNTLAQGPPAVAPQGPLPGGTLPASVLAPPTTAGGVTPGSLTSAPQPPPNLTPEQLRAWQLSPINQGGGGGRLLNPKDPRSPIWMPLPQDVIRAGRTATVGEQYGGESTKALQDIIQTHQSAIAQGLETKEEALAAIKQELASGKAATAAAAGTNQEKHLEIPAHKDAQGNDVPAETRLVYQNNRTLRVLDATTMREITPAQMAAQNAQIVDKPAAAKPLTGNVAEVMQIDNMLSSGVDPSTGQRLTQTQIDNLEAMREKITAPTAGMMTLKEAMKAAPAIAKAIEDGIGDLTMSGLPRQAKEEVERILAEDKFNLQGARNDLLAVQTAIRTMNGPQMMRLSTAINFTKESLNMIDNPTNPGDDMIGRLVKVLPETKGKYQVLNRAFLEAVSNGLYGTKEDQATAGNLLSQIKDLQSELSVIYMGGNAPTDKGLELAQGMLKGEWSEERLRGATRLARQNLLLRQQSIRNVLPQELSVRGQQLYGGQFPGITTTQQETQVNDRGLAKATTPGQPIPVSLYKTYIKVYGGKKEAIKAAQDAGWGPPQAGQK